ncbi:hypothetical protein Geob_0587 [Geotalea daltonii FRC-32]|uniref:Multi-ubiquitin domain-containing protein n=1 Tax=Geotalea daltonii (strain DSM 22248 / JCM 15807 / FRC-32) TaxID=316067 RepID=B9M0B6_GEODF|nr:multiubiquitin domain-containing protein [Geotalea daltonii]ACM18953.1 hypothetical protein Geob_0587 [Geotalea daltonii FRC-32]
MEREKDQQHDDHGKENVTITIDDNPWTVHRGHHTVAELKTLAGVPLAYDLDRVIDGKFEPLPDDGGVTIKGGEIFISHVKDGSSS